MTSEIELNAENVENIINTAWKEVRNLVETENHPLSSEKTLCFLFAMQVYKVCGNKVQFDFENQCYKELKGKSKYLDLLIFTKNFSVAIEFKLPQKKIGNSNQTQTRKAIYRDLARLDWLVEKKIFSIGYFLMVTNEDAYLNNSRIKDYYLTKNNHKIEKGNDIITIDNLPLENIECCFSWDKGEIGYSWLEPITFTN